MINIQFDREPIVRNPNGEWMHSKLPKLLSIAPNIPWDYIEKWYSRRGIGVKLVNAPVKTRKAFYKWSPDLPPSGTWIIAALLDMRSEGEGFCAIIVEKIYD